MDFKQLGYFLLICKFKSFSKAADEAFISQQGLSRSVASLEEELRCKLFLRTPKGVELTAQGAFFEKRAQEIMALYNDAVVSIGSQSTVLKIASTFASSLRIAAATRAFVKKDTGITLKISEFSDIECERSVLDDKCDIAICSGPSENARLTSALIVSEPLSAIVNINHPLSEKEIVDIVELKNDNILIMNHNFYSNGKFLRRCQKYGFTPNVSFETGDMTSLFRGVKENRGICITNRFVARHFKSSKLKILPINDDTFNWNLCASWKKDKPLSPEAAQFIDFVLAKTKKVQ